MSRQISMLLEWRFASEGDTLEGMEIDNEVLNVCWEAMHSQPGSWEDIGCSVWPELFQVFSLLKSMALLTLWESSRQMAWLDVASKTCDLGLLMGKSFVLDGRESSAFIFDILSFISKVHKSDCGRHKSSVAPSRDFSFLDSLQLKSSSVESKESLSLWSFQQQYMDTSTPVVLRGAADDWPAKIKWSDVNYWTQGNSLSFTNWIS